MEKLNPTLLRDVPLEEMRSELDLTVVNSINEFQTAEADSNGRTPIDRILEGAYFPTPEVTHISREKLIGLLACNTSTYSDEIEDMIDEDDLIKSITHNKLKDPVNIDQYTRALRVRRSILALLIQIEGEPNDISKTTISHDKSPCSAA